MLVHTRPEPTLKHNTQKIYVDAFICKQARRGKFVAMYKMCAQSQQTRCSLILEEGENIPLTCTDAKVPLNTRICAPRPAALCMFTHPQHF